MPLDVDNQSQPGFELVDSAMTIIVPAHTRSSPKKKAGGLFTGFYDVFYDIFVRETQMGETRDLLTADVSQDRAYYSTAPKVLTLFRGSVYTPAEHWRLTHFDTFQNAGEAADSANPDMDTLSNLEERAYLRDPNVADSQPVLRPQLLNILGQRHFSVSFEQLTGGSGELGASYAAENIQFSLEQSVDLAHGWHSDPASVALHGDPEDLGNGLESVTFRMSVPINAGENKFLRLRVNAQP
jgi:hypothetical protein